MSKDMNSFNRLSLYAIGHVVFDIVTVLAVNNQELPAWVNKAAHGIFYLFAILFSCEFFFFCVKICCSSKFIDFTRKYGIVIPAVYLCLIPFLPIKYVNGNGSFYSYGPAAIAGYVVAFLYIILCFVLVMCNLSKVPANIKKGIFPMLLFMLSAEIIQVFVPELLFTGATLTLATFSFFFGLENPVDVFKKKSLLDAITGVKNRYSYEEDMVKMKKHFEEDPTKPYTFAFFDISGLKNINNLYGHSEGDVYISTCANILLNNLVCVQNIYRMSGDEFLAVYFDIPESTVKAELDAVDSACLKESRTSRYDICMTSGYAVSNPTSKNLSDVLGVADYRMYKKRTQAKENGVASPEQNMNLSNLTDRIFEVFDVTSEGSYPFLCNLETNVARVSMRMVERFGLPGEFVSDLPGKLVELIHPDDREAFIYESKSIFGGRKFSMNSEFRIMDAEGHYEIVNIRGSVIVGKKGEQSILSGNAFVKGLAEETSSADFRLFAEIKENKHKKFFMRYQPVVCIDDGHIHGCEALLRFENSEGKEIMPQRFIEWFENEPEFYDVGLNILRAAVGAAVHFRQLTPDFTMSVNVTAIQLSNSSFIDDVLGVLKEYEYPAEGLCLELTERCKVISMDELKSIVRKFRNNGIKIALDDAGTGYASLELMLKIPFDTIKFDKDFVARIRTERSNQILTKALQEMSSFMQFKMTFEGVEDCQTNDLLRKYKGSYVQGYYYARPLLEEDFYNYMAERQFEVQESAGESVLDDDFDDVEADL